MDRGFLFVRESHSYAVRCYSKRESAWDKQQSDSSEENNGPTATGPKTPNVRSLGDKLKLGHCHRKYILLSFMK